MNMVELLLGISLLTLALVTLIAVFATVSLRGVKRILRVLEPIRSLVENVDTSEIEGTKKNDTRSPEERVSLEQEKIIEEIDRTKPIEKTLPKSITKEIAKTVKEDVFCLESIGDEEIEPAKVEVKTQSVELSDEMIRDILESAKALVEENKLLRNQQKRAKRVRKTADIPLKNAEVSNESEPDVDIDKDYLADE